MKKEQAISTDLHNIFFVSDGTGLTAESYGKSLLAQFPGLKFETTTLEEIVSYVVRTLGISRERTGYA